MAKFKAVIDIYDDRIETRPDREGASFFTRYWVADAGIHEDYLYPCVMVQLLFEIARMQSLGYSIRIADHTTQRVDIPASARHLSDDEIMQRYGR